MDKRARIQGLIGLGLLAAGLWLFHPALALTVLGGILVLDAIASPKQRE